MPDNPNGEPMIYEIVVVEGKSDAVAVRRAVRAEIICTGGFSLDADTKARIKSASARRGLVVLTDPDAAGEQIRRRVSALASACKHAFVPREDCLLDGDIGVENASPEAIRKALLRARAETGQPRSEFSIRDLVRWGLEGAPLARERRDRLGAALGLGYGNAKSLLSRLNHYGVSREEFEAAVLALDPPSP